MAGQVVVSDQYLQARSLGRRHTVDAGNTVIHSDQQLRLSLQGDGDNFRGQAITIFETVRHQIIDMRGTEQSQPQHAHSAGGRTVRIEVADDQDALTLVQRRDQQVHRRIDPFELLIRNQAGQTFVQLDLGQHAARGIQTRQQRRQVAEKRQSVRQQARFDAHSVSAGFL